MGQPHPFLPVWEKPSPGGLQAQGAGPAILVRGSPAAPSPGTGQAPDLPSSLQGHQGAGSIFTPTLQESKLRHLEAEYSEGLTSVPGRPLCCELPAQPESSLPWGLRGKLRVPHPMIFPKLEISASFSSIPVSDSVVDGLNWNSATPFSVSPHSTEASGGGAGGGQSSPTWSRTVPGPSGARRLYRQLSSHPAPSALSPLSTFVL